MYGRSRTKSQSEVEGRLGGADVVGGEAQSEAARVIAAQAPGVADHQLGGSARGPSIFTLQLTVGRMPITSHWSISSTSGASPGTSTVTVRSGYGCSPGTATHKSR